MSDWWVHPTLGHDTGASAVGSQSQPYKTFAHLIAAASGHRLEANDTINLYAGVTYTEQLLVNGGNTIGRDITGVTVNGNGATITSRYPNGGNGLLTIPVAIAPSNCIIQDLTVTVLPALDGSYDNTNAQSGVTVVGVSAGCIIRRCTITGPDTVGGCDGTGNQQIDNLDINGVVYPGGLFTIQDCTLYSNEVAINPVAPGTDVSVAQILCERTRIYANRWDTCESWIASVAGVGATFNNCYIGHTSGMGTIETNSSRGFFIAPNVTTITISGCTIFNKGRLGQTYAALFGTTRSLPRTITNLSITNSALTAPEDKETSITVTNLAITGSTFTLLAGGAGKTWSYSVNQTGNAIRRPVQLGLGVGI